MMQAIHRKPSIHNQQCRPSGIAAVINSFIDLAGKSIISNLYETKTVMAKSLLMIVLVTMQLLTGSGVSAYLCIGDNFQIRFHIDSNSCTFCLGCMVDGSADKEAKTNQQHNYCCMAHADHSITDSRVTADLCDCIHIPVMLASGHVIRIVRPTCAEDLKLLLSPLVNHDTTNFNCHSFQTDLICLPERPNSRDTLFAVSTVIIRC